MKHTDFRALIRERMAALKLTEYALAKNTGLNQPTLNRYLSGANDMAGDKVSLVLAALGLEVVARK